jgi:predicted DNA-binding transcriptional regulator YafY
MVTGKLNRHETLTCALRILCYLCDHRFGGTVQELADEVGVSRRGIYRYLAAFRAAGIPIERTFRRGVSPGNVFKLRDRRWIAERLGAV